MLRLLSFVPTNLLSYLDNDNRKLSLSLSSSILSCFEKIQSYTDPWLSQSHFDLNEPEYWALSSATVCPFLLIQTYHFWKDKGSQKVLPQLQTHLWSSALSQPVPGHLELEAKTFTSALQRLDLMHSNLSYPFSWVSFDFSIMKSCVGQSQNRNKKQTKEFFWKANTFLDTDFAGLRIKSRSQDMGLHSTYGMNPREFPRVSSSLGGERYRGEAKDQTGDPSHFPPLPPGQFWVCFFQQSFFFLLPLEKHWRESIMWWGHTIMKDQARAKVRVRKDKLFTTWILLPKPHRQSISYPKHVHLDPCLSLVSEMPWLIISPVDNFQKFLNALSPKFVSLPSTSMLPPGI